MSGLIDSVRLNNYPKCDAFLFDRIRDTRQNHSGMKYVTMTYKKYEVTRSVKLNKYPKYDAYILDRASDTRQNHWTMKDRSLRPTKNISSLTVSD